MCCFSTKTDVQSTNIFARKTGPGPQAIVYQMEYSASAPTAMILPLPVALPADDASVSWKSLKDYPAFFSDLSSGFPMPPLPQGAAEPAATAEAAAAPLPVHEVGDFIATFVPSLADFSRVDARFVIPKEIWAKVPAYRDYGFAVFQLKALAGTPHPIAFEFRTRMADRLYFPTVHIHDGTVHEQDHFNHWLYLQDPSFDAQASIYEGPFKADASTGYVRSKEKLAAFADAARSGGLLDGALLLHRTALTGMLPNADTFVRFLAAGARVNPPTPALPTPAPAASGCGGCALDGDAGAIGPSGLALLGLAWIIRRRSTNG